MQKKQRQAERKLVGKRSFADWLARDPELAALRREHAGRTAAERAGAADWAYHGSLASEMFGLGFGVEGETLLPKEPWPAGYAALAIDPDYAPALLTVGTCDLPANNLQELRSRRAKVSKGSTRQTGRSSP